LGGVDLISLGLGVKVGLLEVLQEVQGTFNGVNGLGLQVGQGGKFVHEGTGVGRSGHGQNEKS